MLCKTCHYSLTGLTERGGQHRCPECGRAFDPKDPATFTTAEAIKTEKRWSMVIGTAAMIASGVYWLNKGFKPNPTPVWYTALGVIISLAAIAIVLWHLPRIHKLRHKKR